MLPTGLPWNGTGVIWEKDSGTGGRTFFLEVRLWLFHHGFAMVVVVFSHVLAILGVE